MNKGRLLVLTFVIIWVVIRRGQSQQLSLHFHQLNTEHGLTSPTFLNHIFQDQNQKIWISSLNGLQEFDGQRVRVYQADKSKPNALINPWASYSRFFEGKRGEIWFTNVDVIIKYLPKTNTFHRYFLMDSQGDTIQPEYTWMHLDTLTGQCFTYANDTIYTHNLYQRGPAKESWEAYFNYNTVACKLSNTIYDFIHHRTNEPVLDFIRFDLDKDTAFPVKQEYTPDGAWVNNTVKLDDTHLLVATKTHLWSIDLNVTGAWNKLDIEFVGKQLSDVVDVEILDNNLLLLATRKDGLYIYDEIQGKVVSQIYQTGFGNQQPFLPRIEQVYVDYQRNLWVITARDGIWYANLDKVKFAQGTFPAKNEDNTVLGVAERNNGNILVLKPSSVLELSQEDTIRYPLPLTGDGVERPNFVLEDSDANVWVGSLTLLLRKRENSNSFEVVAFNGMKDPAMGYNSAYELYPGALLFATNDSSSFVAKGDQIDWVTPEVYRPFFAKPLNQHLFSADHKRQLFIHSVYGASTTADTVFQLEGMATGIVVGDERDYYVATMVGLYHLWQENDTWHLIKEKMLAEQSINSIHIDQNGYLWLAGATGLIRFDPINKELWQFTEADGLQGSYFNYKSILSHSNGSLIVGGINGINVFRPENIRSTVPLSNPSITRILINESDENLGLYTEDTIVNPLWVERITVPFHKNHITLFLSAMEYSAPQHCHFKYRLLGSSADTSWIQHGTNSTLDFPNLSYGDYVLEYNATNSDGVWAKEAKRIEIQVNPPWYLQNWFLIVAGAVLLAVGFAIARRENRREMEKEELRTKEAEARTDRETAKKLAAQAEAAVLRLQMDPHFIYNALNGVDDMIQQGKNNKASEYLYNISHLMRRILNESEELNHTITEEIELLEQYIETEQIRFGDHLKYHFTVDDSVNANMIEIPTMILQPFIENAIWHGIAPKEGTGIVKIHFTKQRSLLVVRISDDGVGRSRAPRHLKKKYESKAIQITKRRFDLYRTLNKDMEAGFEIIDLFDKKGVACGTSVVFSFAGTSF